MERYKVVVPDGVSGDWRVEKFEVKKDDMPRIYYALQGRDVPPGVYSRLVYRNEVIMSDTTAEVRDHWRVIHRLEKLEEGSVLINGLGLGVVLRTALLNEQIEKIVVVEISEDVIKLVAPTYTVDPRVLVIHADALRWRPDRGARFEVVWHDIWPTICSDNLEEMKLLHRSYGRRCAWQGSWARELCERQRGY